MKTTLLLGFEVGSGEPVEIPLKHTAITGQTQEAGKTTALEALIDRSGLRAVTFITKRGESSFTKARRIDPYFRDQADWQFVSSILEAARGEKLKFERAWIIRASKGARTLADVQDNVRELMAKSKRGMDADVYLTLDAYLEIVVPQISEVKWASGVDVRDGVNVVDMTGLSVEMQHLVIRSTINWVLNREVNTIVVVPEAWKFIPQGRNTPVKLAAESYIRQAAACGNYLWLDSQDLGGIDKQILRNVPLSILGVQREANEIKRTLSNIPAGTKKPKADEIATLQLGEFYACWGTHSIKTYVQPMWLPEEEAKKIARGDEKSRAKAMQLHPTPPPEENDMAYDQKMADLEKENGELKEQVRELQREAQQRKTASTETRAPVPSEGGKTVQVGPLSIEAVERSVAVSLSEEPRSFSTTTVKGKILYVCLRDLNNKPSTRSDIVAALLERGWNIGPNTMSPELGGLTKNGDLIVEGGKGGTYRLPGKVKLSIDGK